MLGLVSLTAACQSSTGDDAVDPVTEDSPTEQPTTAPPGEAVDPTAVPEAPAAEGDTPETPPATTTP
ncbi:MAG: hypothetical protein HC873_16915 [Leptolyngbyaceae cyanobacterium SL_1_1]|nr:hypothetical protein [Leptolyngbyaceae cyanobacterium SL_1_1]